MVDALEVVYLMLYNVHKRLRVVYIPASLREKNREKNYGVNTDMFPYVASGSLWLTQREKLEKKH